MTNFEIWYLVSQYLLFVTGVIYAVVAYRQLRAISRQASIAEKSAEAAQKSAEVALKADRPYLLMEKAELAGAIEKGEDEVPQSVGVIYNPLPHFVEYKDFCPIAIFHFRNYGKGPALPDDVAMRLQPLKEPPNAEDFSDCHDIPLSAEAIGAGNSWVIRTFRKDGELGTDNYKLICDGGKEIFAYGRVRYHDLFNNGYEVGFCWLLPRPTFIRDPEPIELPQNVGRKGVVGNFVRGPKGHNYSKETGKKKPT